VAQALQERLPQEDSASLRLAAEPLPEAPPLEELPEPLERQASPRRAPEWQVSQEAQAQVAELVSPLAA
jgi:hypothetical protein